MTQNIGAGVLYEPLLFTDQRVGGAVNDGTDQAAHMTTFVNLVNQAGNGAGVIPPGVINITPPTTPWTLGGTGATTSARIEGSGGGGFPNGGATVIQALSNDTATSPFTKPWFLVGGGSGGDWTLGKLSLKAAQRFGSASGIIPSGCVGVQVQGQGHVRDIDCSNFAAAAQIDGDHLEITRLNGSGCGVGLHVPPGVPTQGDITLRQINASGKLCTILVASSSYLAGAIAERVSGSGEPYYILRYDDGGTPVQDFINGMELLNCGVESIWHGAIYDELHGTAHAGNLHYMVWMPGGGASLLYSATTDANTWMASITGATVSAATATVTVPAGFWVRPGMVIVDGSGHIAANTTVTSIAAGSWPGTSYTLNLSSTPSGNPTGAITLMMPRKAVICGGVYSNNEYHSVPFRGGDNTIPVHLGNWFANNTCDADCSGVVTDVTGGQAYVSLESGLFGGQFAWGNSFGSRKGTMGANLAVGTVASAVAQYDVVEYVANGSTGLSVQPATGVSKPAGIALRAASSGAVAILQSGDQATVKNKTAGTIAANAPIYADQTNHGGVTATQPGSGWTQPIGMTQGASITAGATGTALIWG